MARKRKGEREDGYIQVQLDVGRGPDGKRQRKSFYGRTRAEAEKKRDQYKARLNGGRYRPGITVAEWTKIYMDTYRQNVDPAYLRVNAVPYNRLIKELGMMRMEDVLEADLQESLNQMRGMSFSSIDKYRQAVKRVFARARKNKIIIDDPAEDLIMPPYTKGTHRALEAWEVQHILAHWNEPGLRGGLWVLLMLFCGLRRGEMVGLDWSAVDLDQRLLRVEQVAVVVGNQVEIVPRAKSKAGLRSIPICAVLFDALSAIPEEQRQGPVCVSVKGKRLSETAVSRGLTTFCDALERLLNLEPLFSPGKRTDLEAKKGTPRKTFRFRAHDLRHTFATMLFDAGVDVKTAAYLMGHSDIRVTMDIYTHLSQERRTASEGMLLTYLDALPKPQ